MHSDDPAQPRFQLTLKGEIRPVASFTPTRLNLGRTMRGETSTHYAYLSSELEGLEMVKVRSNKPEVATAKVTQHQGKAALEITVKAEGLGHQRADLEVTTNKPDEVKELRIAVTVLVSDPVYATPTRLLFNTPPDGKPAPTRNVRVEGVSDKPFTLTKAEDLDGQLEATIEKRGNAWYVRAVPKSYEKKSGTLRIHTDLKEQPTIDILYTIRDTPARRAPIRAPKPTKPTPAAPKINN